MVSLPWHPSLMRIRSARLPADCRSLAAPKGLALLVWPYPSVADGGFSVPRVLLRFLWLLGFVHVIPSNVTVGSTVEHDAVHSPLP